ncbi:unnamed protein product [Cylicocyclus nassatus]|uniref:Uncharacterized protein n=1 Tax=Cylicocyclus nassatus TaxID=53992 RepID=A0AA36GTT7_CYLNA|nr:unnamed protein product [Cylicocyclus nassatus]
MHPNKLSLIRFSFDRLCLRLRVLDGIHALEEGINDFRLMGNALLYQRNNTAVSGPLFHALHAMAFPKGPLVR